MLTVAADVADPAAVGWVIDRALERFGRIETLVNNAGMVIAKLFTDYTAADYAAAVGASLAGFFWLTQRAIAEMATRYGGHVVNISAGIAEVANSGAPSVPVALTRGGLAAATRSLPPSMPITASGSTPSPRESSRRRCTYRIVTTASAAGFPRSAGPAGSATWWTACCSWSPRPTSPARF